MSGCGRHDALPRRDRRAFAGDGNAWLAGVLGTASTYTVTAVSISGDNFPISRVADGSTVRTCSTPAGPTGGACSGGTW